MPVEEHDGENEAVGFAPILETLINQGLGRSFVTFHHENEPRKIAFGNRSVDSSRVREGIITGSGPAKFLLQNLLEIDRVSHRSLVFLL